MNNGIDNKIIRLKNVQNRLSKLLDNMRNEDIKEINDVWQDKNSVLFIDQLNNVFLNINSLISMIDDTIKDVSRTDSNGGLL